MRRIITGIEVEADSEAKGCTALEGIGYGGLVSIAETLEFTGGLVHLDLGAADIFLADGGAVVEMNRDCSQDHDFGAEVFPAHDLKGVSPAEDLIEPTHRLVALDVGELFAALTFAILDALEGLFKGFPIELWHWLPLSVV